MVRVWTNHSGEIVETSVEAASLLNISDRAIRHRPIHLFFNAQRDRVFRALEIASRGHMESLTAVLRPREKRVVDVEVQLQQDAQDPHLVCWTITPVNEAADVARVS